MSGPAPLWSDLDAARQGARAAADAVAGLPNVLFVTLGEKRTGGRRTGGRALVAYVRRKLNVPPVDQVPPQVNIDLTGYGIVPIATDVVETVGAPRLLGVEAGDIVFSGGDRRWGTTCLTFDKGGRQYIATNAHVLADLLDRHLSRDNPAIKDFATNQILSTGPVVYVSPFPLGQPTDEDFAVIRADRLTVDALVIQNFPQRIARFGRFGDALDAAYQYATNGLFIPCEQPERHVGAGIVPEGSNTAYIDFWSLTITAGMAEPGHSGSLVFRERGGEVEACGILFGGAGPSCALVFELEPIYDKVCRLLPTA